MPARGSLERGRFEAAILDVFAATDFFDGPYRFDAPDLLLIWPVIGFATLWALVRAAKGWWSVGR